MSEEPRPPFGFERFRRRAAELIGDTAALRELGRDAVARIEARAPRLGGVVDELRTLVRMLSAWGRGEYREVPRATMILVAAALLYFVVPFDVIPDFLVGVGLVDDIAVVGWVVSRVRGELDAFRAWELKQDAMSTMIGTSQVPDERPPD